MLTIGVEEEFLLLDPGGGVAPVAAEVARDADADGQIKPELMAFQLETATRVCTRLDELHSELVRLRLLAARGAQRAGAHLVAVGMPPYRRGPLEAVTSQERYLGLVNRFPAAITAGGACACQVHIGVPDRDLGVEVLVRLRPWLATLLAMTGNSPIVGGADTGWNSSRYRALLHWPTFRPPAAWTGAAGYDRTVRALVASGAAGDVRSVKFLARLSPRYPTIEIRVSDTCLTVEDTLLIAAVVRALVATLIDDARRGLRIEPLPGAQVSAGLLSAAHHGMSMPAINGWGGPSTAHGALLARLHAKILPAMEVTGDAGEIARGLERLTRTGSGADRQRLLWARASTPEAFVASLRDAAVPVARQSEAAEKASHGSSA